MFCLLNRNSLNRVAIFFALNIEKLSHGSEDLRASPAAVIYLIAVGVVGNWTLVIFARCYRYDIDDNQEKDFHANTGMPLS